MRYSIQDIILGTIKTIVLLIGLELVSSALLPAFGVIDFKPAFNVLIVLYLAFKLEAPVLPFLILLFQYTHSIFSIEGWATGTLAGILVASSVKYVKDMLNFSSAASTIIVVQIFQIAWFLIIAVLLSLKLGDFGNFFTIFFKYIPESIFLSLTSPFFFKLLDRFWSMNKNRVGVGL